MPSIRRRKTRSEEERERVGMVAKALLEAEPAEANKVTITLHVPTVGEQLPRIPVIGMEGGAIRGTIPHRAVFSRARQVGLDPVR